MHEKNKKVRQLSNKKDKDKMLYVKKHGVGYGYRWDNSSPLYCDEIHEKKLERENKKKEYKYLLGLGTREYLEKIVQDNNLTTYVERLIAFDSIKNNNNISFEFCDTIDDYTTVKFKFTLNDSAGNRSTKRIFKDTNLLKVSNSQFLLNISGVYFLLECIVNLDIKRLDVFYQNGLLINCICSELYFNGDSVNFEHKEIQGMALEFTEYTTYCCKIIAESNQFKDLTIKSFDVIDVIHTKEAYKCCCLNCTLYTRINIYRSMYNEYKRNNNIIIMCKDEPFYTKCIN